MKKIFKNILIISSLPFLFINIISCKEESIKCEYQFQSLATGRVIKSQYILNVENNEHGHSFSYRNDSTTFQYEINGQKGEMRIIYDANLDNIAFFAGKRQYEYNGKEITVECYKVDNEERLGENLLIFWNQDYGVLVMRYTSFIRELISFNGDTSYITNIIRLIKEDTTFYKLGN